MNSRLLPWGEHALGPEVSEIGTIAGEADLASRCEIPSNNERCY